MNQLRASLGILLLAPLVSLTGLALAHEDLAEQIERVQAALRLTPDDPSLWLERGELHRLHGDLGRARADYAAALARGAPRHQVALCNAAAFLDAGNPERALLELQSETSPPSAAGWKLLQRCYQSLGRRDEADLAWRRSLDLAPAPDGFLELARWRLRAVPPDTVGALEALHQGLRRSGPAPGLLLTASRLEAERGDFQTALSTLEAAPEATRNCATFLERRGDLLQAGDRPTEAREVYGALLAFLDALPASRRATTTLLTLRERVRLSLAALPAPEDVR